LGWSERGGWLRCFALVDQWLAAGQHLSAIGGYLHDKPATDIDRLRVYAAKAIERGEQVSVVKAATIAANWYQRACQHRDKNGPGTGLKRGQLG
jgi:hypothetical protein